MKTYNYNFHTKVNGRIFWETVKASTYGEALATLTASLRDGETIVVGRPA